MYLKEAFRYQNFLSHMISRAGIELSNREYTTKITQEHLRKKANPDAENETVEVPVERTVECTNNQMVSFLEHIMEEKEKLTAAISAAKHTCDIDIDAEIASNRVQQNVARLLADMSRLRASEIVIKGTGYKFNGEGNQVPYTYDIKQVTTIDFDRNRVRGDSRALIAKADEVSNDIDKIMVTLVVDYEPEFSVNDSFEDAVAQFVSVAHTTE